MSEQIPPQEPEETPEIHTPLCYTCPKCNQEVESTYDNGLYVTYEKQPWFDHIRIICEEDGFIAVMWVTNEQEEETAGQFMRLEDPDDNGGFCDEEDIVNLKAQNLEITPLEEYELSPGHEKRIQKFGETLINMPDDHILDEFSLPMPPRQLPERWV